MSHFRLNGFAEQSNAGKMIKNKVLAMANLNKLSAVIIVSNENNEVFKKTMDVATFKAIRM